jgi:phage-related protein
MKKVIWIGSSLDDIRDFPPEPKQEAGRLLRKTQEGDDPHDVKNMPSIGVGVKEIRIHHRNEYRIIYVTKFREAVYVLHCFIKKTMKTDLRDIHLAKERFRLITRIRGQS